MVLWSSQGELLDRTRENLGPSDDGLLLYRRVLQQQVSIVEDGGEPMNTFRRAADMGNSLDLQPRLPPRTTVGGFDPDHLEDDVEQYSPAVEQITALYRESFPKAGAGGNDTPSPRRRAGRLRKT